MNSSLYAYSLFIFFMVFQCSKLVFHGGSKWVSMVFQGSSVVFHGVMLVLYSFSRFQVSPYCSWWVLRVHCWRLVFKVSSRFFMVAGGFSLFFYGSRSDSD